MTAFLDAAMYTQVRLSSIINMLFRYSINNDRIDRNIALVLHRNVVLYSSNTEEQVWQEKKVMK